MYRRQSLTSKVGFRTERIKVIIAHIAVLNFLFKLQTIPKRTEC